MTYPVDTTDPTFPSAAAAPDSLVSVSPVRNMLECDRAAWAWSRRVLCVLPVGVYDAGDVLLRVRQWVAPIPSGWERRLVLRVLAQRSTGTANVRLTLGAATAAVSVGTTQVWGADDLVIATGQQGTNALLTLEDLGSSGTITIGGVVYESVGAPPP
jgi:hypothetical protein